MRLALQHNEMFYPPPHTQLLTQQSHSGLVDGEMDQVMLSFELNEREPLCIQATHPPH